MEGDARPWFQMLQWSNLLLDCWALTQAMEAHFGLSPLDSPRAALFKLVQIESVYQYYHQFSALANHMEDLPDTALLDYFISGLKSDIKREVLVQAPSSLFQAVALAKLYEEKVSPVTYTTKACYHTFGLIPTKATQLYSKRSPIISSGSVTNTHDTGPS